MGYLRENDDLPWELRRGVAKTLRFAPKFDGINVVAEPSPAPTFEVYSPAGILLQSGEATISNAGTPEVSTLSVALSAISTLGERYSVRVTWRVLGSTEDQLYLRQFDVVLWPFDQPTVSANELAEDRPDLLDQLDAFGQRFGYAEGNDARTNGAAICAVRARLKLISMIRANMAADVSRASENRAVPSPSFGTRPALILNREALALVERHLTLEAFYNATAKNPLDGEEASDKLAQWHRSQANEAWQRIKLDYDTSEDLVPDAEVEGGAKVTFSRRAQA